MLTPSNPSEWAYYIFQSGQGIAFEARGNNLFELVFRRGEEVVWQQVFFVYPQLEVYETGDLFRKHPEKEELWSYAGRRDDMIVLANSANMNAAGIEEKIMRHPDVSIAMVGGAGEDRAFVIVELRDDALVRVQEGGRDKVFEEVWGAVDELNEGLSDYTRLRRESVVLCGWEKRLVRGPKGNLLRGASLEIFKDEIRELRKD
jgi:acyl-CoA synthetase (AMP-forming)/AMP-acid ligase II